MPSRRQQCYYKQGIKYYPVALPRPRRPRTRPVLEGSMSRRSSLPARSHDNEGYRRRRASRSKRVVASDHHGTRTEVALACREAPTLAPIEAEYKAEYNRRLQAMEQRIKLLESKVPTHDNFEATKIVQAAAQLPKITPKQVWGVPWA